MRPFLFLLTTCLLSQSQILGQSGGNNVKPAKTIFFEFLGPGILSLNYDMRLTSQQDGIGFRAGIGYSHSLKEESLTTFPLGLNYLSGKNSNYWEFGGGYTFVTGPTPNPNDDLRDDFYHLNVGYRKQPIKNGFLFRVAWTPVFGKHFTIPYYGGISVGYKF